MKHKQSEEAPSHPPISALCPLPLRGSSTLQVRVSHRQVEGACTEVRARAPGPGWWPSPGFVVVVFLGDLYTLVHLTGGGGVFVFIIDLLPPVLPFHIFSLTVSTIGVFIFCWESV